MYIGLSENLGIYGMIDSVTKAVTLICWILNKGKTDQPQTTKISFDLVVMGPKQTI